MGEKYNALVAHLREIRNLERAGAVLAWDQQVNMPNGGASARAAQLATLSRMAHELMTSADMPRLLEEAQAELNGADYDSDEASLIRVTRTDYDEATRLPSSLVAEITSAEAMANGVWVQARKTNDFASFVPALKHILELQQRKADLIGYTDHVYDAFLNEYERGMTAKDVKRVFEAHKPDLIKLIAAIRGNAHQNSDALVNQHFDIAAQRAFSEKMAAAIGYDFERGRLDEVVHPFCITFAQGDVRITTRFHDDFFNPAFFGTLHESGHAMYEQGVSPTLEGTPLSRGTSLAVHESQSRLWENFVGRSRNFWEWAFPQLVETFPTQFSGVDVETFYRAVNTVQPSFIRVEADEATYNLHIMLRFELEMELVTGAVKVEDLPREWNERFEAYFGIVPPTDSVGVLQDVHWSSGLIGYFPTYALGNLLTAQYYRQALMAHPNIPADMARGDFTDLREWMRLNIYQHGRKFTATELTKRITGEDIECGYYMDYLDEKYSAIYGL